MDDSGEIHADASSQTFFSFWTVLSHQYYPDTAGTMPVSSQEGLALNCPFMARGQAVIVQTHIKEGHLFLTKSVNRQKTHLKLIETN